MRIFQHSSSTPVEDVKLPVLFTANAISYLSSMTSPINLSEWQSYEDIVDGRRTLIVTDRLAPADRKGERDRAV